MKGTTIAWISGGLVAVALTSALFVRHARIERAAGVEEERVREEAGASVPVTKDDPTWGSSAAPVTIAIFGDFQDPFLVPVVPVLEQVKTHYGPTRVRIVWKNRPAAFHPDAWAAAIAGQELFLRQGNDAFWEYVGKVFADPSVLRLPSNDDPYRHDAARKVAADAALARTKAMQGLGYTHIDDSPTLMINGMTPIYLYEDDFVATEFADYRKLIDRQIADVPAKPEMASLYAEMCQKNGQRESDRHRQGGTRRWPEPRRQQVEIGNSATRGPADAPVTVVELSDFECRACRQVDQGLTRALAKYPTQLRVVWKHHPLPFERNAEAAALLSLEALSAKGQKGFWAAHDALFAAPSLAPAELTRIAGELGLDPAKFASHKSEIDADQRLAMSAEAHTWMDTSAVPRWGSVDGGLTPILLVNGVTTDRTFDEDVEQMIDRAIAHAGDARTDVLAADPPKERASRATVGFSIAYRTDLTSHPNRRGLVPASEKAFQDVVAAGDPAIHACYDPALRDNPTLAGRVFVEVLIDQTGKVLVAQDGGSSLPDARTARCIVDQVKALQFPATAIPRLPFAIVYALDSR